MHINGQVRDAVATTLEANTSLERVASNGAIPLLDADMSVGVVMTPADQVARFSKGTSVSGPTELRTIQLVIVAVLFGDPETIAAKADAVRVEIEPLVAPALTSIARTAQHTGADWDPKDEEEGESWYGFLSMTWDVEVVTAVGDPETAII